MATVTKKVLFTEVYSDESRNPRVDYSDCEPNSQFNAAEYFSDVNVNKVENVDESKELGFYEDITMNGILVPIDVAQLSPKDIESVKKITGKTYKYRTIRGHRRMHVLASAAKYHKEWFKPGGKFYEIPAIVHTGLTYDQEMNLLIDQFGVKSLNAPEVYRAIRSLKLIGLTEKEISQRVHMSRGFVQRRIWITTFPEFVYDAWINYVLKHSDDTKRVNLTDGRLVRLNKAANEDRKANIALTDPASKFMETWNKIISGTPGTSAKPDDADSDGETGGEGNKQKMMTRQDIEKLMLTNGLDDIIKSSLKVVLRESDRSLDAVNVECIVLRKKALAHDDMLKSQKPVPTPKAKKA